MMLALAAVLTTFSLGMQVRDLPVYDHDELGECFTKIDETLHRLLETVAPNNFISLPLRLARPSIYATSLAEDRYMENTKMYLAVNAGMNEADLIQMGPNLSRCARRRISSISCARRCRALP